MTQTTTVPAIELDELTTELRTGSVAEFWNVLTDEYFGGELISGSGGCRSTRSAAKSRQPACPRRPSS